MEHQSFKTNWMSIDRAADPYYFVRLMDTMRGGREDEPDQYRAVFDMLDARGAEQILDVGCGTGGAVRALAKRVGDVGRVVGIDSSATMIAEARRRTAGSSLPVEFCHADAHQLPFADNSFDGAYSLHVFEIVGEPRRALAEVARVTRPGGRILVNGPDMDTWAIDSSDREVTRKILHYVCDYETNGWIGRQLPALCGELGLADVSVVPAPVVVNEFGLLYDFCLRHFVERAVRAGAVSAEEASGWLDDLRQRDRKGQFLCIQTRFRVFARKP